MNKRLLQLVLMMTIMQSAAAVLTQDSYIGLDDHGWGDRIGATTYEIMAIDVDMTGTILSINIFTEFAGQANSTIGYGDVFIGSWDGQPFSAFEPAYALAIDNRSAANGIVSLYETAGARLLTTDDMTSWVGGTFRNGQFAAIDTTNLTPIDAGNWLTTPGLISFSIETDGINFGVGPDVYWGPTCGNDIIIGRYDINAPGSLSLILAGSLLAAAGAAHNRRRKNGN